jgi:hypothetical protein
MTTKGMTTKNELSTSLPEKQSLTVQTHTAASLLGKRKNLIFSKSFLAEANSK